MPGTKSHPHSLPTLVCCHGKEFIAASPQVCLCNCEAFYYLINNCCQEPGVFQVRNKSFGGFDAPGACETLFLSSLKGL